MGHLSDASFKGAAYGPIRRYAVKINEMFGNASRALAGIGPLLFLVVATILGLTREGYDAVEQPISALAVGPGGWMQALNFALLATSFLSFAAMLRRELPRGASSIAAPSVFVAMMVGVAAAGIFPMDAPGAAQTLVGKLHMAAGFLVFPWMPVVLLVLARRFRRDAYWQPLFKYTLATALCCLATLVVFLVFVGPPESMPPRPLHEFAGVVQRVMILPFFTWMALIARRAHPGAIGEPIAMHSAGTSKARL
jgi:hypothetical protein